MKRNEIDYKLIFIGIIVLLTAIFVGVIFIFGMHIIIDFLLFFMPPIFQNGKFILGIVISILVIVALLYNAFFLIPKKPPRKYQRNYAVLYWQYHHPKSYQIFTIILIVILSFLIFLNWDSF